MIKVYDVAHWACFCVDDVHGGKSFSWTQQGLVRAYSLTSSHKKRCVNQQTCGLTAPQVIVETPRKHSGKVTVIRANHIWMSRIHYKKFLLGIISNATSIV